MKFEIAYFKIIMKFEVAHFTIIIKIEVDHFTITMIMKLKVAHSKKNHEV